MEAHLGDLTFEVGTKGPHLNQSTNQTYEIHFLLVYRTGCFMCQPNFRSSSVARFLTKEAS